MTEIAVQSPSPTSATLHDAAPRASGVVIAGLRKGFGTHPVLRGVDLEVPKGSITAILGPSGSGKTTLLRLLAGFERPDGGTISIDGTTVDGRNCHLAPGVRRVGYVPQEGCLFPHLDVRANVGFGLAKAQRRHRVAELLEMTGLAKLGGRYPHQLSGGEQQRVALARALAPDPSLVLLDEPFSSLDASLRTSVRLDVARILNHAGTTTVIVTHDQDEALSMADQVAILRDGLVAQASAPEDLYTRPADARLAQFVGDANLLGGTVRAGCVETPFGPLGLVDGSSLFADGTSVVVLVRPEQIHLVTGEALGDGLALPGLVLQCDYHGHDTIVAVDAGEAGLPATINVRCMGPATVAPGATVMMQARGAVTAWAAPRPS